MKITNLLLIVFVPMLAGCVSAPEPTSKFDPGEAAFINAHGSGSIVGQAFLRRNDGIVVYAAGSDVLLIPGTAYADERMRGIYRGAKFNNFVASPKNTDPQYTAMTRKTKADGEGRFTFSDLADGRYYVGTQVFWSAGDFRQGGSLMETASVLGGSATNVIMSGE